MTVRKPRFLYSIVYIYHLACERLIARILVLYYFSSMRTSRGERERGGRGRNNSRNVVSCAPLGVGLFTPALAAGLDWRAPAPGSPRRWTERGARRRRRRRREGRRCGRPSPQGWQLRSLEMPTTNSFLSFIKNHSQNTYQLRSRCLVGSFRVPWT